MTVETFFESIKQSARDEIRGLTKRPWLIVTGIVMPIFWMLVLCSVFADGLMRGIPVGIVDHDLSTQSRETIQAIETIPSVKVVNYDTMQRATEDLRASKIFATVHFPQNWAAKKAADRTDASVELYWSKTCYPIATTLEIDIKKLLANREIANTAKTLAKSGMGLKEATRIVHLLTPVSLQSGNTNFNFRTYLLATLIPGVFALCVILTATGIVAREWHEKKVASWISTYGSISGAFLGKLIPWIAFYSLFALLYVAWFAGFEGNTPVGSVFIWCLASVLLITAMISMASLFVACSPNWIVAMSVSIGTTAPIFPYTGFSYPLDSMSAGAQLLGHFLPLTWFLKAQSAVWILGSSTGTIFFILAILSLFTIIPLAGALLILPMRLKKWAKDENKATAAPDVNPRGWLSTSFSGVKYGFTHLETVVIFAIAVVFYLLFYAWPYMNQTIIRIPTAIVDCDQSALSRAITQELNATSTIRLVAVTPNENEGHALYRDDKVSGVITIPKHYERDLLTGRETEVALTANGAFPVKGRALEVALTSVIQKVAGESVSRLLARRGADAGTLMKTAMKPPVFTDQNLFNTLSGYASYTVPMVSPVIIQAVLLIAIMMTLGAWLDPACHYSIKKRFLTDSRTYLQLLFGYFIFALAWLLYAEGLDFYAFDYTSMANPGGTVILCVLYCAAIVSLGFVIALLMMSHQYGAQLVVVFSAPALFLSGCAFPAENFGLLASVVRLFIPSTPGIMGLASLSQNGASIANCLGVFSHLLLLIIIYTFVGLRLARRNANLVSK